MPQKKSPAQGRALATTGPAAVLLGRCLALRSRRSATLLFLLSFRPHLRIHDLLDVLAHFRGKVTLDAALPDVGSPRHLARDDRALFQQFLAGLAFIECRDAIEFRFGERAGIDESSFTLQIRAPAGQR